MAMEYGNTYWIHIKKACGLRLVNEIKQKMQVKNKGETKARNKKGQTEIQTSNLKTKDLDIEMIRN